MGHETGDGPDAHDDIVPRPHVGEHEGSQLQGGVQGVRVLLGARAHGGHARVHTPAAVQQTHRTTHRPAVGHVVHLHVTQAGVSPACTYTNTRITRYILKYTKLTCLKIVNNIKLKSSYCIQFLLTSFVL